MDVLYLLIVISILICLLEIVLVRSGKIFWGFVLPITITLAGYFIGFGLFQKGIVICVIILWMSLFFGLWKIIRSNQEKSS